MKIESASLFDNGQYKLFTPGSLWKHENGAVIQITSRFILGQSIRFHFKHIKGKEYCISYFGNDSPFANSLHPLSRIEEELYTTS